MPDLEDAIGDMVTDLHAEAGRTVTYRRDGVTRGTLTMSRHRQQSQYVDNEGRIIEFMLVDFIGKTAALEELGVFPPLRTDQLVVGSEVYDALPTTGEKVFRRISDQMTRIHTKQVSS